MNYLIGFAAALLISALLIPLVKKAATALGAVDNPKESARKIHQRVMARGGGLAIYASFLLVSLALLSTFPKEFIGLIIAGTMVLLIGLIDDIRRLNP